MFSTYNTATTGWLTEPLLAVSLLLAIFVRVGDIDVWNEGTRVRTRAVKSNRRVEEGQRHRLEINVSSE
jgi:hypothetical protein